MYQILNSNIVDIMKNVFLTYNINTYAIASDTVL